MLEKSKNPQNLDNESITNAHQTGVRLRLFLKDERDRVDTPALIRWDVKALALKDMAQVRIAF